MNKRITVSKSSGGDFVLADYTDIILDNPAIDPAFSVQVVEYLRGDEVAVFDRMNERNNLNFTLMKEFTTLEAAIAWRYDVRSLCPRVGKVSVSEKGYGGAAVNRFLSNAAVLVRSLPNIGIATFTQVSIIGGKFNLSK